MDVPKQKSVNYQINLNLKFRVDTTRCFISFYRNFSKLFHILMPIYGYTWTDEILEFQTFESLIFLLTTTSVIMRRADLLPLHPLNISYPSVDTVDIISTCVKTSAKPFT